LEVFGRFLFYFLEERQPLLMAVLALSSEHGQAHHPIRFSAI
jgi:hypothetical protein